MQTKLFRYQDENRLEKLTNTIDLFLFDTELIDGLLQPSNDIVSNCSMSTLVSSLLYDAGCRKILMSPIDNVKIYDRIILPPQSIYDNIKYLDTYYGLYKTGSLLYFGLDRAYLLKYGPFNDTFEKGEYDQTTILISRSDSSEISQNGEIVREGENQNVIPKNGKGKGREVLIQIPGLQGIYCNSDGIDKENAEKTGDRTIDSASCSKKKPKNHTKPQRKNDHNQKEQE